MKLTVREIVFLVLLFAIPLGMYFMVFMPRAKAQKAMQKAIDTQQEQLSELTASRDKAISNTEEDIDLLKNAVKIMRARLPEARQADKVIQDISILINANNLQTRKMQTSQPRGATVPVEEDYGQQWMMIELEGDFMGFYSFLQAMENLPRVIRVHRMRIDKLEGKELEGQISAMLEIQIFFKREGKKAS